MARVPLNEVDVKNLIKMSWNQVGILLNGLTPKESNQVIKVLLEDLEALQSKLIQKHDNDVIPKDVHEPEREVETIKLNFATDIQDESVEPNSKDHFFQENDIETIELNLATDIHSESVESNYEYDSFQDNELAVEGNFLEDQGNENLSNDHTEIIDNEWYTFVSNDKGTEVGKENKFEDDKLEIKESKEVEELKKSMCQKSFAQYEIRTHTGGKPFLCNTCKKGFACATSLKRHEKTHTGEKPHKCITCNKGFTLPQDLKRHERIHAGEKPYKCKHCEQCFVQSTDLSKHD